MAMSNFDPTDRVFAALGSPERAHLNKFLAQQVANASKVVRVSNVNTCVELPKYDHRKMTSQTFFEQCRNYLNAQGYEEANHHEMLPMLFKGEMRLWYDSISSEISDWDDFKTQFQARFDSNLIQRERSRILHSKRQGMLDPSEQFVYESYNLAKQVDPTESDKVTLERIRDSLFPDIAALVGDIYPWKLNILLEKVAVAHNLIERQYRRNKYQEPRVPPLKGLREDLVKAQQRQNENIRAYNSRGRGHYRSSFNQHRGHQGHRQYSSNAPNDSTVSNDNTNSKSSGYSGNSNFKGRYQNNSNYRGNSHRSQNNYRGHHRGRGNSNTGSNANNGIATNQCRKCLRYGHYARECPNQVQGQSGVAMIGHQSFQNNTNTNQQISNPNQPENNIPLNYLREHHDNSNRGYSHH